ncbi:MAG: nucleotide sugar dehydrogenase [Thermoproteota archaeon]
MIEYSISPEGVKYEIPTKEELRDEFTKIERVVQEQKEKGREIVTVMGLGFVGAVMAAVVADAKDSPYFVLGYQRPSKRSYWKIQYINSGIPPVSAEDPEIPEIFRRTVLEKKTLLATSCEESLGLADIIVVDIQLDAIKPAFGKAEMGYVELDAFKAGCKTIGKYMKEDALVLIETTVPPGTCEKIVLPILKEEREKRGMRKPPCLAHSYERVMPGRKYVSSIRDFWRTWAGINRESSDFAGKFLSRVVTYPLYEAEDTNASEVAKVLENSYRAVNIAFIYDWTLRAEEIGIDLWKVLPGIRVRPTHNNIMNPGLGVGGYCLTKDSVLANWAFREIFGCGDGVPYTIEAIDINDKMPFHTVDLVVDALKEVGRNINGSVVTILGASYLADVGDTRHSPSEILIRRLKEMRTEIRVHDPYVKFWPEFAHQDEDEFSLAKQFKNQEGLKNLKVEQELEKVIKGADAIVFAVRHKDYLRLEPKEVLRMNGGVPAIVDAFNIIDDDGIMEYLRNGCSVRGVGKGHIRRLKQLLQRG